MEIVKLEARRGIVREELLRFLRENVQRLRITEDRFFSIADPSRRAKYFAGVEVQFIVRQVYERLSTPGKIVQTLIPVPDSRTATVHSAFYRALLRGVIFEEIYDLIKLGVLVPASFNYENDLNYDLYLLPNSESVVLTEYGLRCVSDISATPFFVDEYLNGLHQVAELSDELKGYLSEGLTCLRHGLARAAIILLRLAAQDTLEWLEKVIAEALSKSEAEEFNRKVRQTVRGGKANLRDYAEVIFHKLTSSTLLQGDPNLQKAVSQQLQPAFHAIRDLAGDAAHLNIRVELDRVSDLYTLYSNCVYKTVGEVIEHLKKPSDTV